MRVRKVNGLWSELLCLEDTGSSSFTIFQGDDVDMLDLNAAYPYWEAPRITHTANGNVFRTFVRLELQVLSAGPGSDPIGPVYEDSCAILPGFSFTGNRLSGMGLHRNLFVATAPDGARVQYIGEKKNGVVRQLPIV